MTTNTKAPNTLPAKLSAWEGQLIERLPTMQQLLPARAGDPQRFLRMAVMAATRNPELLECDRDSFVLSVMNAAELGLSCSGGTAARAHLVPFNNSKTGKKEVVLIPDYKGLVDIALDSGKVDTITGACVYEKDVFREVLGSDPKLVHVPARVKELKERGEIIGAYAIAFLRGASRPVWRYLERADIEKRRPKWTHNTRFDNPWFTWLAEMCVKTAIRSLYKVLPTTPTMERAAEIDDATFDQEVEPEEPKPSAADMDPKEKTTPEQQPRTVEPEPEQQKKPVPKTGKVVRDVARWTQAVIDAVEEGKGEVVFFTIKAGEVDESTGPGASEDLRTTKSAIAAKARALLGKQAAIEVQGCKLGDLTWIELLNVEEMEKPRGDREDVPF